MANISALVNRRGQLKGQLTRFSTYVKELKGIDLEQLTIRREKANVVWEDFDQVQTQIEEESGMSSENEEYRSEFEELYFKTMASCDKIIKSISSNRTDGEQKDIQDNPPHSNTRSVSSAIKLAALEIPKFSGDYMEWSSYQDIFTALVHNDRMMDDVQKFFYLRSSLSGEAENCVRCMETTSENYHKAWKSLVDRYSNKRVLIKTHTKSLFNLEPVKDESAERLRKLYDSLTGHFKALETLGENPRSWGSLILYLITTKLDPITLRQWETETHKLTVISVDRLLEFLQLRFRMLEAIESVDNINTNMVSKYTREHKAKKDIYKSTSLSVTGELKCYVCKLSHTIYKCPVFLNLSIFDRIKRIDELKLCKICLRSHHGEKCKSRNCPKCTRPHNGLLHITSQNRFDKTPDSVTSSNTSSVDNREGNKDKDGTQPLTSVNAHASYEDVQGQVLLSTAVIFAHNNSNEKIYCRVLLDSGSQNNFITNSMAKHLQLKRKKIDYSISGINQSSHSASNQVSTKIKSRISNYETYLDFIVMPALTNYLPSMSISSAAVKIPEGIELADPSFNVSQKIDMIIGSEIFFELICTGQVRPTVHGPTFQKTLFGWIVAGPVSSQIKHERVENKCVSLFSSGTSSTTSELEEKIARFWRLEEIHDNIYSAEEKAAKIHFEKTIKRAPDNRFIVSLPFRDELKLGKSYDISLRRFLSLERRLSVDDKLKTEYTNFLDEYLSLGHMEIVPPEERDVYLRYNYLPHHAVIKESSTTTKLRVVFDASSKSDTGVSLNDILCKGPCIQEDLVCIMTRFRTHRYVISADIIKMYRQVWISEQDRDYQRILWRSNPERPIQIYRLKTITYGVITASYLATGCLQKLSEEECSRYPAACRAIGHDFYMDDLLSGADTKESAIQLRNDIITILNSAGFELSKWSSNAPELVRGLSTMDAKVDGENISSNKQKIKKLLGIFWNQENDSYQYKVERYQINARVTKRNVLAEIASVFDPLGLINPITVRLKLIMQKLWQINIGWDEPLPTDLLNEWKKNREDLESINSLVINRLIINSSKGSSAQIHGFADASISAYGACLYIRTQDEYGNITTNLICAKSRVAPLKVVTLPRLELLAAVLLTRLAAKYVPCLQLRIENIYYWTDSTIVLAWISAPASKWKTFVGHRVSEIQELSSISQWRHVNTDTNPADIVSRGCSASQIIKSNLWWNGPDWLRAQEEQWPKYDQLTEANDCILEEKTTRKVVMSITCDISILNKFSSMSKLLRVIAYCLRFAHNAKPRNTEKRIGQIQREEINNANVSIVKLVQRNIWQEELIKLSQSKPISSSSRLLRLKPFVDENGLLRVGGRLKNADTIDVFQKHPVLLPPDSQFTRLVFLNEHEVTLHGGPQVMLARIRLRYWPLNGRNIARKIMRQCVKCFKYKPIVVQPIMGDLPKSRVEPARAFSRCGVDFAGPVYVRSSLRRKSPTDKAYICLWVCFVTKAVHIELVSNLTTEAFLNALNRFFDRRGICTDIYSDNATNFVGANRQLQELKELFLSEVHREKLQNTLNKVGTRWHFIPPRSPHFGGLWEASVKSVKSHLYKTVGNASLTYEELYTVLVRVEAILNSRPITPMSSDPTDLSVLTPGHFLIGNTPAALPERDVSATPPNRLTRWRRVTQLSQQFWYRWQREYLSTLQAREKWCTSKGPNLAVGTIVLVREDNLPPLQWKIGRIIEIHSDPHGVVRVAVVRTSHGQCKRAVRNLCTLPFEGNETGQG